MDKGHMTTALKIWLNPEMVKVQKDASRRPPSYISVHDRQIAQFASRNARRSLLTKQRQASSRLPRSVLRLLRHRDQRAGLVEKGKANKRGSKENAENTENGTDHGDKEAKRVRDVRVEHLAILRATPVNRNSPSAVI
jgi:hypothetical protein